MNLQVSYKLSSVLWEVHMHQKVGLEPSLSSLLYLVIVIVPRIRSWTVGREATCHCTTSVWFPQLPRYSIR